MTRDLQLSPGAVAEALGVPVDQARAAIQAADLRDERGRPKMWFSADDLSAIQAQLRPDKGWAEPLHMKEVRQVEADEDLGEPEPVSAADLAAVQHEVGRRRHGRRR